jgi:group II intron reverse transcriptase/maturase
MMNGHGKSDRPIVPANLPNKGGKRGERSYGQPNVGPKAGTPEEAGGKPNAARAGVDPTAEGGEGRGLTKGNLRQQNMLRTLGRESMRSELERVRKAAEKDKGMQFTALMHHVYNVDNLREAYFSLKRKAAPGLDEVTWGQYGRDLEENLRGLSERLKRGAYRARPVRRVHIPKEDGRQRPIGVPTLEDKIVQGAAVNVLNAIYEVDFLGFSYGFRPGRNQHNALDALTVGIERRKVNWVLDADIRGFFDAINHEWMVKFIQHRIADKRIERLVRKWLKAGVLEDGRIWNTEAGTPQGGSISPLLANIYLHYVFDLWAHDWRQKQSRGDVIIGRYADDSVVGFQYRDDAERFLKELRERLANFSLELHPEKTRLIEFGRFAAENRRKRGVERPETFNFLGFTHMCGKTSKGGFTVKRVTMRKRLRRKLKEIAAELRKRFHDPIEKTGKWLRSVLIGHYRYYGVPYNARALGAFRSKVTRYWKWTLSRRSQKGWVTWDRMKRLVQRWLPKATIYHPFPGQRLCVRPEVGAR